MEELLQSPSAWALYFLCAMLIGMSKTGIMNIGTLTVPIFAWIFGAKYSTGIVLILLCFADTIAVIYYRKAFLWSEVKKLLPMALLGLGIGLISGNYVNDKVFKVMISVCLLLGVVIMVLTERSDRFRQTVEHPWYSPLFGLIMGFSTMVGNAAGPALSVYMLSKKLDKVTFTATSAWFIMILNFTKIPLQALVWKNLTWEGIWLNIMGLPFILLGGFLGIKLLKILPEKEYRQLILALVVISSLFLMLR
ncbi:sulfite exporter TauE/SafE family protein [Leadbetterella byssophila]|uniref:Probable membrane transporter protein n=1 Tax=Leadbetterella byssophila (strain DSM 17132 / JCM 16389 / KACC 11308 / NBRC 106382 / 4M15) TaxID=649349 RepID=E4RUU8_LEAB4|nr:sulfite exporter TauE/SafE family protein [Leadbetterella byssophila]ADQ16971.1 protein of unknown function DUF81 [Leadbetterella byssophila DSM 17132]